MSNHLRQLGVFAVIAAGLLSTAGAQAQYYYVQQTPNDYAIERPFDTRAYPYRHCQNCGRAAYKPGRRTVINTRKVVYDSPVVVETRRVVDDPPRVSERHHKVRDGGKKRVIKADAEITILGDDRMNIRLFRKGQRSKANAQAE